MRVVSVVFVFLFLAGGVVAQGPSHEPVGHLAHVMRGILFPNSNILFDVPDDRSRRPQDRRRRGRGVIQIR